ncbi:hypothetical protein J8L98_11160 [Pseudoalteromonas sp. MMG013]|nr:hypothetical protein [Pseudoalteromonas sp. MMG013]
MLPDAGKIASFVLCLASGYHRQKKTGNIMKVLVFISTLWCAFTSIHAISAMPSSQLFVAEKTAQGVKVKAITSDDSYHNQPLTTDNGVYFTKELSTQEGSQTDLFFYDFTTQQTRNLTNSPVSEYSPTLYPHDDGLSTIVVESTGKQRLWFYPFDSARKATPLLAHIDPVGYHVWGAQQDVMLFVLGTPHELHFTDTNGHLPKLVAKDIDRSLAFNKAKQVYSFTYNKNNQLWLATYSPKTELVTSHFVLPKPVRDYTWLDDDTVAYAVNNRIYMRSITSPKAVSQWMNLTQYCKTQVTRLSHRAGKVAFVCKKR